MGFPVGCFIKAAHRKSQETDISAVITSSLMYYETVWVKACICLCQNILSKDPIAYHKKILVSNVPASV